MKAHITPQAGRNGTSLTCAETEIVSAVREALSESNPKEARAKLKSICEEQAQAIYPDPDQSQMRDALEADLARATHKLLRLKKTRDAQTPLTILRRTVKLTDINFVDKIFGGVGLGTMAAALLVIPLVSAASLSESGKIPMFADSIAFSGLCAVTGLGGVLSASAYRDTLRTDEGRRRFDQTIMISASFITLCWASTIALSAFPITLGVETAALPEAGSLGDWGEPASEPQDVESGFTLSAPPAFVLIATALMEIVSGAVCKIIASTKLTPKRTVGAEKNPAIVVFDTDLVPPAEIDLDCLQAKLTALDDRLSAQMQKRLQFVSASISRFETLLSTARQASDGAINQALSDNQSVGKFNDFSSQSHVTRN